MASETGITNYRWHDNIGPRLSAHLACWCARRDLLNRFHAGHCCCRLCSLVGTSAARAACPRDRPERRARERFRTPMRGEMTGRQ
jgi:hypothetical protein